MDLIHNWTRTSTIQYRFDFNHLSIEREIYINLDPDTDTKCLL